MGLYDGITLAMSHKGMPEGVGGGMTAEKKQEEDKRKRKVVVIRLWEGGVL